MSATLQWSFTKCGTCGRKLVICLVTLKLFHQFLIAVLFKKVNKIEFELYSSPPPSFVFELVLFYLLNLRLWYSCKILHWTFYLRLFWYYVVWWNTVLILCYLVELLSIIPLCIIFHKYSLFLLAFINFHINDG